MYKKIVALSLITSCLIAANTEDVKDEIKETKAKIAKLKANLKELQSTLPKEDYIFKARAEIGYVSNSGNTNTEAFNADTKLTNRWDLHSLEASMLMQYGTENNKESKNRFLGELLYDYKLSKVLSLNYLVGYKDDKFSGYDYQFYTGPGAKYVLIETDYHDLNLDGNFLYVKDKIYGEPINSYLGYRIKGVYNMQMLENLKFHQTLSFRSEFSDVQNYFLYSKTAFTTKLSDIFSAGIAYHIDYTNHPPFSGKTSTDKMFTFNLIADY
ncbi:Putative salt-induced outer membrane protein-like protein [Sulfurimonas denitrificans DSM 1251]|uniref:Putative salt-induced outer membrane protein-like protein n=1 Tax=Sulfurimonas denitrificans (strain ATCC 33889 / DSM 1251) TaxID=326298 RepID=Q30UK4_SULDN|nr:DUF481 domain-containing protein [Sulfurimonas denitrificans]ABB43327.1 Putative salt-induced outer membrane protein-like protein [Sulfurimonas denitrificans DSM 1251]